MQLNEQVDCIARTLSPSASVDPPSMVLDRAADSQNAPTLPAGVTSSYPIRICCPLVVLNGTARTTGL